MKSIARIALSVCIAVMGVEAAQSRPVIIEESAVLRPPAGVAYEWAGDWVGTNGEYAIMTAARVPQQIDEPGGPMMRTFDALLYRRVDGNWIFQRILDQGSRSEEDYAYPAIVGMKGNLASVLLGDPLNAKIFRFNGTDWLADGRANGLHEDVAIDAERILYGVGESWNGRVYEPDGSGGWSNTFLPGQFRCCDDEFWGGPVDLLGTRAILATPDTFDLEPQEIPIYERYGDAGWQLRTKIQLPPGELRVGSEVGLHDENALVTALRGPPFIYSGNNNFYEPTGRLEVVNAYARNAATWEFAKSGEYLLASAYDPDLGSGVINVFRQDSAGKYQHVAILKPKSGTGIGGRIQIDGNTVIASSDMKAVIFQLPATLPNPKPRYENFETSDTSNWTPTAGSSFAVVRPTAGNGVYRQTSTVGDAQAVLARTTWTHQSVEADIRPTAFGCADCWVGLATRYADAQNYYYVTLRGSQTVQLKRMRAGVFTTLASAPLTVTLNRNYRLRLESIGSTHRVFVDGRLLLTASDTAPLKYGNAAIVMYRAKADYDNVSASPGARGTLFANDFTTNYSYQKDWTYTGTGQWAFTNGRFVQSSVAGDARAISGSVTDDQIVSVRVRPVAYAASSTGQERWVGLMARYRDDQNYYYLTLRSGNSLSLRKLVNGVITVIGTVPATVTLGSWYSLRLEITGNQLRAWLNDTLVIQATDSTHALGRAGPVTAKAAADYDDYVAYRP